MKQFEQYLPKEIIKKGAVLSSFTTFGIGGKCLAVLLPRNKRELIACVKACKVLNKRFQVLGNGSNILASSKNTRRVFIVTTNMEKVINLHETSVNVGAGTHISELILWCEEKGLSGLECLFGIPATIGGCVMMNAGAFGQETYDCLEAVEIYNEGKVQLIDKNNISYSHHKTSLLNSSAIVLSAEFNFKRLAPSVIRSKIKEVMQKRTLTQPKGKSAGCVFRASQGIPAGKLIDELGLKGLRVGGAVVSDIHANFIINDGGATDKDVKKLIEIIQLKLKEKTGFEFEREIEYIGDRDDYYR